MRIVLLSAASSVHTMRWANAFADRGHEVHLISQHEPLRGYREGVHTHLLPHRSGAGYLLNGRRLRRLVNDIGPDVVNAHYATGYGTLARAVKDVPVVLNVWGSDVFDFPEKSAVHRWWLARNLRAADRLVSTSEVMADRTMRWVPDLPRPIVVPFGVDTVQFSPLHVDHHEGVVIGTVKALAHKYGIDTLIDAFQLLRERPGMERIRLRIIGTGPDRDALVARADNAGLGGLVEFVGGVPHAMVPQNLDRLDIFVALSRNDSESFGVAVIEASSCGLPVVVSDAGGLPEVVVQGATGFVVPREDPAAAAERLGMLVHDAQLRERMGAEGRRHVIARYEWKACVDRQLAVLDEAARQR